MFKRYSAIMVALCCTLGVLGACGDDDDTATDDTTVDAGDGEQAAGDGDFCPQYSELLSGEPTPDQIRALIDIAPDDAKEPLETIAAGVEDDPEAFFDSDEFNEAFAALGSAANEECADQILDVTAVDYGYEGLPEEIDAGTLGVNFANDGDEVHEMIVLRKNDDTTESFDEILALEDQAAAEALVTEIGAAFAFPGSESGGLFDLSEPGDYIAICFIPVGSTPDAGEEGGDGPPHFTQGMQVQFSVS